MAWPPFPGPLWGGVCVCQWDMGQMVDYLYPEFCQESLHSFGNKEGVLLGHSEAKTGGFTAIMVCYTVTVVAPRMSRYLPS